MTRLEHIQPGLLSVLVAAHVELNRAFGGRKKMSFTGFCSCNGNTVVKIIKAGGSSSGMRKCITFYSIRDIDIGASCDLFPKSTLL